MNTVVFDFDDTLAVDEAISREALGWVADMAHRRQGADAARFFSDASRIFRHQWLTNPVRAYCEAIGISYEESLYGQLAGGTRELASFCHWAQSQRRAVFALVLAQQGIPANDDESLELSAAYRHFRRRAQRLMPDVIECLTILSASCRLAILTNGAPSVQMEKIRDSGLARFFQEIVVSGHVGIGKPRKEIFHHLLEKVRSPASHAVMVGNSLARDILGAQNAGFGFAVHLHVPGSLEPAAVTPDATIFSLSELPNLLSARNRTP